MRARSSVALFTLLAACSAAPPPPAGPRVSASASASVPVPAPPTPPAGLHLPTTVWPTRYAATLTMVPTSSSFQGAIEVELDVKEATNVLWLNATELSIDRAELRRGGETSPLRVVPGGEDLVGFLSDRPIPRGPATLSVTYRGAISDKDDHGVFKEHDGGEPYLFTQFENIAARRAFPCFDEPSAKVPWQLTLEVRSTDLAFSNTAIASETPAGAGMKRVRFAETKPLPSYLVAFAVGPFEIVDAGRGGKKGTPVRIVVPRGHATEAASAAQATPVLLGYLEDYFGIPFPYDKLDVVSIPQIATFGAMENPGLITYYQAGLLASPGEDTATHKRHYADIISHELAHHWFGDLVTMSFWDDVWLNEAFATWMETKALSRYLPGWSWEAKRAHETAVAMRSDSLITSRKVRQEIMTKDDIENAFDNITYLKGAALLDMFESWIGPERFQKGIHRYLEQHAHGNASSADFAAAISAEAGQDVAPVFASFLDHGGVPLVEATTTCTRGVPAVELRQSRFLPKGSSGSAGQTWQIPVCVRWGGKAEGRACTLLTTSSATMPLPAGSACPSFLVPNAGNLGYYHVGHTGSTLDALLRDGGKPLRLAERLGLASDLSALIWSGGLPIGEALARVPVLMDDPSPHVQLAAAGLVASVPERTVPASLEAPFARFVSKTFGARARAIGLRKKPGENEEVTTLRPLLLQLAASRGEEPALVAEARALALAWLDDPGALDAEVIDVVLAIAAAHGDRALWDRLHAALPKTRSQNARYHLLGALSVFRDPALVQATLDLFLRGEVDPREAGTLLDQDVRSLEIVEAFLAAHFDEVVARLPADMAPLLPGMLSGFCDEPHRASVEALFKGRIAKIPGGPRELSQALEQISLCTARREAQAESLRRLLTKR